METNGKRLGNNRDIRRILLLSTAVMVLFEVCLTVMNIALNKLYANAVGLDGLQTRAMLETARLVVQELGAFLLPFWQIAVIRVAISKHRSQPVDAGLLTFGFRRFGPVLGLNLLMGFVLMAAAVACTQVASILYTQTDRGRELGLYLVEQMPANGDIFAAIEQIPVEELLSRMAPVFVVAAVLGLPAVYFVWCRFRMAKYLVMDDVKTRAFPAMIRSFVLTKRQFWNLLRLDLRLWWYYVAQALVLALGFLDLLLPLVGVKADPGILTYVMLTARSVARLAVAWFLQHKAELAYAAFYENLWIQTELDEETQSPR